MWYGKTSVFKQKFQDPLGIFFTKEEFPALAEEKEDVSRILQSAIDRLTAEQCYGILYIPEGEYPLKETVKIPPSVRLIGYGRKRPVFVLPQNIIAQENKRPMFWFIGERDTKAEEPKDANAATFYSAISNVDFRVEKGNPGAVCIRAHFAQHGFVSHCHFDLGDAYAGLFDVGNEMEDLTFVGGQYGIVCRMCSPGWPFALLDSVFTGQEKAAVLSSMTGFTGFRLQIFDTPRAFALLDEQSLLEGKEALGGHSWEKLYLEDCTLKNISEAAITFYHCNSIVQQTNLRRLYCENVPVLIKKCETQEVVKAETTKYELCEYVYGYQYSEEKEAAMQETIKMHPIESLPAELQSDIPPVPPMSQWVSVAEYGAVGDGVTDDTKALQTAMEKEDVLYFPQGIYRITDTLVMKENGTLFGLSPITTQIVITDDTPEFSGFGTPKALLETAKGGFAYVNGIGIDTAGKNPRAAGIKWMAGASSYMNDVKFVGGHGLMFRDGRNAYAYLYNQGRTADYDPDRIWDYQYSSLWVTENGGGVFKDLWSASPYAEAGITITDTQTRGRMYAISLEHHVRHEMKLYRVKNWSFYALQTEEEKAEGLNCLPLELVSCENLLFANFFLFRVVAVDRSYRTGIRVWDCKKIELLNLHNKAQMQFTFPVTFEDGNGRFIAKSPEYAKLYFAGEKEREANRTCIVTKDAEYEVLAEGFDYAQGAAFDEKGRLYWCDKSQKRIFCYDPVTKEARPFYDIHFVPSALAVDTEGNLLVAVDYSALRTTKPGEPCISHDETNFHPFFSWFYQRGEKVYAVEIENPFNTMTELVKAPADAVSPERVIRPAQLFYYEGIEEKAQEPVTEYYMAPDGRTALQGTIDLARSLLLAETMQNEIFYITDDLARKTYGFEADQKGNLTKAGLCGNRGQNGSMTDGEGIVWTVEDKLYGFKNGELVKTKEVPWDGCGVIACKENVYLIGRSCIYQLMA